MGQLAGRLKELVRLHGGDDSAWRPRIDAVAALEAADATRAHAAFVEAREALFFGRYRDLLDRLRARAWLADVPDDPPESLTERALERALMRLPEAERRARRVEEALAEAERLRAGLAKRRADLDSGRFARVPFASLARAEEEADALRRAVAREAQLEARYVDARRRASRLAALRVDVPDLSSAATPDPDAAARALDAVEAALAAAERAEDAHARVARALRDPAAREFTAERRKALLARAETALAGRDEAALDALAAEAEALRAEAAALAQAAARARKRGARGPEKERRKGDPQDYFG